MLTSTSIQPFRAQTQRLMHFLKYKYEKRTASYGLCTSSLFGWRRRSWAAPASPSLEGEVRPFWASRNLFFCLVMNSSANNHTDSCTTWKAQRNQSLLLCKEVSDYMKYWWKQSPDSLSQKKKIKSEQLEIREIDKWKEGKRNRLPSTELPWVIYLDYIAFCSMTLR